VGAAQQPRFSAGALTDATGFRHDLWLFLIYQVGKLYLAAGPYMEISFTSGKLQKLCSNEKKMRGELGPKCAAKLQQRLTELAAAENLEDLRNLPGARCHELTGDLKGCLAVDLQHPQRLIFEPDHDSPPAKPDGGLDWEQVTRILIRDIQDYH
jgi:toxin HigB-1